MVTSRLWQAAGACLTMCPMAMCGKDGAGNTPVQQQQQLRHCDGSGRGHRGCPAWVACLPRSSLSRKHRKPRRISMALNDKEPARQQSAGAFAARAEYADTRCNGVESCSFRAEDQQQHGRRISTALRAHPPWWAGDMAGFGRDDARAMGRRRTRNHGSAARTSEAGAGAMTTMMGTSTRSLIARGNFHGRIFRLGSVAATRSVGEETEVLVEGLKDGAPRGAEEELAEAFSAAAGDDGLLSLDGFRAFADVRELLENGLLKNTEVMEIWKGVSKVDEAGDRVDLAGFREAFVKVDALFEEEEEEGGDGEEQAESAEDPGSAEEVGRTDAGVATVGVAADSEKVVLTGAAAGLDSPAANSFVELAGSASGVIGLQDLLSWSEITELLEEELLTRQEVESMWESLPKVSGGSSIDLRGFQLFDNQLSDLFEEEGGSSDANASMTSSPSAAQAISAVGSDGKEATIAPPSPQQQQQQQQPATAPQDARQKQVGEEEGNTLDRRFEELCGSPAVDGILSFDGLSRWNEVSELLEEELLSEEELRDMWESLPKADNGASIDLAGFVVFARKLDQMFEAVEEDDAASAAAEAAAASMTSMSSSSTTTQAEPTSAEKSTQQQLPSMPVTKAAPGEVVEGGRDGAKARLLELVQSETEGCGIGCEEGKRAKIAEAMEALTSTREGNLVYADDLGDGLLSALEGEWRLLYTSSNSMEFNQGLTGLANTIPNARFSGLRQILHVDGMVFDAEYEEELSVRESEEPLIITVTSDWEVKQTSSLITGDSTVAVSVFSKQIKYGFITVRAERWKTLRAMMLLDISYLDADMRIMRGQTARQNFFVFVRV